MFNWVEDGEDPLSNVTIEKEEITKKDINFIQELEFDSKINRFDNYSKILNFKHSSCS